MTAKTKTKKKKARTQKRAKPAKAANKLATGRGVPITEKEINQATKLAKRKAGVTRKQLAERLKVGEGRAANILKKVKGASSSPLGESAGKACRTLVFRV